jgi:hypothetical protein
MAVVATGDLDQIPPGLDVGCRHDPGGTGRRYPDLGIVARSQQSHSDQPRRTHRNPHPALPDKASREHRFFGFDKALGG